MKLRDILGINARHLEYLRPFNPTKSVHIADSKLKTKRFLEVRGIRVPKLLQIFTTHQDLKSDVIARLPSDIVIKPNASSGGEGIVVLGEKVAGGWKKLNGDLFSIQDFIQHVESILSGAFSISGFSDRAFIEKRIIAHEKIASLSYKGLPDIRIIVFNLVPVIAMLRLPTLESDGKANLHMGGIGTGIDISKGEITYVSQFNQIISEIPGIGSIQGFKIPFWDEILSMASKAQYETNIGYLGVDIALTNSGPLLLEINARAGLSIQVANLVPLRRRLERVKGLKIKTVEKGVRIAKDLFGRKVDRDIRSLSGKTVVGTKEYATFYFKEGEEEHLARIQPTTLDNYLSEELFESIKAKKPHLLMDENTLRIRMRVLDHKSFSLFKKSLDESFPVTIGKRELKNFLIDPYKYGGKEEPTKSSNDAQDERRLKKNIRETLLSTWKETDLTLETIELTLSRHFSLTPLNIKEELATFIQAEGEYNPFFVYKNNSELVKDLTKDLDALRIDEDAPQGRIFEEKRQELLLKLELLATMGQDNEKFTELGQQLYTFVDPVLMEEIKLLGQKKQDLLGKNTVKKEILGAPEVRIAIVKHLDKYKLPQWNVIGRNRTDGARVSVSKSKKRQIYVNSSIQLAAQELPILLAHEVDVHVLRMENALRQPYHIFKRGTAGYLMTEEGLAVYLQMQQAQEHHLKFYSPAFTYAKTVHRMQLSFAETVGRIKERHFQETKPSAEDLTEMFRKIIRVKRGIGDTSLPGGFPKDLTYFAGYKKIEQYVANGGDLKKLYYGKISLHSIDDIMRFEEIKPPRFFPK